MDNVEDFRKLNGESLAVRTLQQVSAMPDAATDLLKDAAVLTATLYKNALSLPDLSLASQALRSLLALADRPNEPLQRKVFFALTVLVDRFPPLAEQFTREGGVALLERAVAGNDAGKERALQMYRRLLARFPRRPELSTVNVCSRCMEDLTGNPANSLLQTYLELLQTAKEQGEESCLDQLRASEGFMRVMREKYRVLRELARKGRRADGE